MKRLAVSDVLQAVATYRLALLASTNICHQYCHNNRILPSEGTVLQQNIIPFFPLTYTHVTSLLVNKLLKYAQYSTRFEDSWRYMATDLRCRRSTTCKHAAPTAWNGTTKLRKEIRKMYTNRHYLSYVWTNNFLHHPAPAVKLLWVKRYWQILWTNF